jgi:rhodanese-related sulfurtransferase
MTDLQDIQEHRDEWQIVDVRESDEWEAGRIEGAIHLPLARVMAGQEKGLLEPDKKVGVVCRSGNRSELASVMLRARGYDAYNMEGGMQSWQALGLPFSAMDGGPGRVA